MQQFHIRYLVTKDGGSAGGFAEKAQAAAQSGAALVVLRRPEECGETARLWNANTQATYHRMMEKMQALYYHLQRFTQCLLNRGFRVLSSSTGSVYVVIYST